MTKLTYIMALGLCALGAPAIAQHANHGAYAPMVGATDPCLLGTNVQPGACVGPVRVAPMIISQGGVQMLSGSSNLHHQATQHVYAQPVTYAQAVTTASPQTISHQVSGCVSGYSGPSAPCNGSWVPEPNYAPQPVIQSSPQYAPMVQYVQVPQYAPAPVAYVPQPQPIGPIPTSFFTGGITYGAGFPTDTTYSYGGGGFGYSTGGTRFSGVRERSPTPLVAPARRQRHAPPAKHHGCGC